MIKRYSSAFLAITLIIVTLMYWEYEACNPGRLRWYDSPLNCSEDNNLYFLLSRPSSIAAYIFSGNYDAARIGAAAEFSFLNSGIACLLALLIAVLILCIGAFMRLVWNFSYALVWILQIIPFIAISWVFSLMFGELDKIAFGMVVGIFPLVSNTFYAVKRLPYRYEELLRIYGSSTWTRLVHLILPQCLPAIFSGLYLAAPLCMVGVLIADLNGGPNAGLGMLLFRSTREQDPNAVALYTIIAVSLSFLLYGLVALLEVSCARVFPWYYSERERSQIASS